MSLSDIMSNLRLDLYAEVALVLFLAAFAGVAINVWSRRPEQSRRDAHLPLEDESAPPAPGTPADGRTP